MPTSIKLDHFCAASLSGSTNIPKLNNDVVLSPSVNALTDWRQHGTERNDEDSRVIALYELIMPCTRFLGRIEQAYLAWVRQLDCRYDRRSHSDNLCV